MLNIKTQIQCMKYPFTYPNVLDSLIAEIDRLYRFPITRFRLQNAIYHIYVQQKYISWIRP